MPRLQAPEGILRSPGRKLLTASDPLPSVAAVLKNKEASGFRTPDKPVAGTAQAQPFLDGKGAGMIAKLKKFIQEDIWRIRTKGLPPLKAFGIRYLRILLATVTAFQEHRCQLRAS